jgi:hypothetical protein
MSEVVGVSKTGTVGGSYEWDNVDEEEETGAVEGFEEWGAMDLPTKTEPSNDKASSPNNALAKGSAELGLLEADTDTASATDCNEDAKNAQGGENWSWGAAWTAFTTAVQQVLDSCSSLHDRLYSQELLRALHSDAFQHFQRRLCCALDCRT